MSYLTHLKGMLVQGIKETFDDSYPEPNFRKVHCSIEYPVDAMNYPGIWVDYADTDKLRIAGVDHQEQEVLSDGNFLPYTRWRFGGYASYTITALTSLECDRLFDELVKVFAFGRQDPARARFRAFVESNDFIAANFDFDEIEPRGNAAAPGTPWGTDEIIYERTINMEVIGEFVSSNATGELVPLSKIILDPVQVLGPNDPDPAMPPPPDGMGEWV